MTKIAFIGTGFVADYYMKTLQNYPDLNLTCCWDQNPQRLEQFCTYYDVQAANGLGEILAREDIDIIVNLTTPESHFEINRAALNAGKHVYCEKPLAMCDKDARALAELAVKKTLSLHSAPANAFSPAFVHTASTLQSGAIGRPRMIYAEMEDGPVFWNNWQEWRSVSGAVWPGIHEFEIGCTLEHAGYALSWLLALFGPVQHLSASQQLVFPDKGAGTEHLVMAPDLTVGLLHFNDGIQARLSCGLGSKRDRSLTILGEKGILTVDDLWDWNSPIRIRTDHHKNNLLERAVGWVERKRGEKLPVTIAEGQRLDYDKGLADWHLPDFPSRIDFAAGLHAHALAIEQCVNGFFSGNVSVHMTEVTLALQAGKSNFKPTTYFDPEAFQLASWPEPARSDAKH